MGSWIVLYVCQNYGQYCRQDYFGVPGLGPTAWIIAWALYANINAWHTVPNNSSFS